MSEQNLRINLPDGTMDMSRYVLRLSVLDDPWKFTRARIRVKRNFRDGVKSVNPCRTRPVARGLGIKR